MVVKNNPDKFPEGYVRLRGCGKRKLCRIFYVKRIAITIVFQKNMCNFAGLMLYILDFMVRCKVAYLTFYMAIFSAINFVMSFNLLTHTHTHTHTHNYIEPFLFAFIEGRSNCTLFPAGYV